LTQEIIKRYFDFKLFGSSSTSAFGLKDTFSELTGDIQNV
jgi:hypothetical protein